jgi:nitrate reductase gamma subunit
MLEFLEKVKRYLWAFIEIAFAAILAIMLIYIIMGADAGVFVNAVAQNVLKFAAAIPAQSLVGLAIVLALIFLVTNRLR